jgi:hypothetical protein
MGTTDAIASDLLATKKAISQGKLITGAMPNKSNQGFEVPWIKTGGIPTTHSDVFIPEDGYYTKSSFLRFYDLNLISGNIRGGTSLFGVAGKASVVDVSDSTWNDTAQILSGYTAYAGDGKKWTGTMPNHYNWAHFLVSQGGRVNIPAGYHNGAGFVDASFANLVAGNIKSGVNVGGVVGTLASVGSGDGLIAITSAVNGYGGVSRIYRRGFAIQVGGIYKVRFRMWAQSGYAYGAIYVDNVQVGTVRGTPSTDQAGVIFDEDISIPSGSTVQLYTWGSVDKATAYVNEFSIYSNVKAILVHSS